jgi:hypothetical protein
MNQLWNGTLASAAGVLRGWGVLACTRCAGVMCIELKTNNMGAGNQFADGTQVAVTQQVPSARQQKYQVDHLPEEVAGFFADALVVLDAGVPDAAAVQLRRTLEAAAARRGVKRSRLVDSVQELIKQGAVTQDFAELMTYVRRIGNLGAHATDEKLTPDEVDRSIRFTAQLLRILFEVPAELAALKNGQDEVPAAPAASEDGQATESQPAG